MSDAELQKNTLAQMESNSGKSNWDNSWAADRFDSRLS